MYNFHRVTTCWDYKPNAFIAFVTLACVMICMNPL